MELHSIISYDEAGGGACAGRAGLLVFGRGSWIVRFSGFLNYIPSYRHTCGTASFNQIIDKNVN